MESSMVFSVVEVSLQLERILDFYLFKKSHTLTRFLEYVVAETINGREQYLKEYSVAVDVLNRSETFSSSDNAIVRIHAGRLRRALREYYLTDGVSDLIFIHIPKGSYVPKFQPMIKAGETVSEGDRSIFANPSVAVFPFKTVSSCEENTIFSKQLGDELSAELSRFADVSVIGYHSVETVTKINQNVLEAGATIGADYIITGNLLFGEKRVRCHVNLLITATGEVVMTKILQKEINGNFLEIQNEIIQSVVCAIGGYYGFIFQEMERAAPLKASASIATRKGVNAYHNYQLTGDLQYYHTAFEHLEHAVKTTPNNALCWAMLGEIYLDSIPLCVKKLENPIEDGYRCANRAIEIDPLCQHAWHTLCWACLIKKEKELCFEAGMKCIKLNPNGSIMAAGAALMLVSAGYFEEGFPVMENAVKKNQYYPWWMNMGFIFYYLHIENYQMAAMWAEMISTEQTFWTPLLKSATLSYLGRAAEANEHLIKLLAISPETPVELRQMLSTFILCEETISQLIAGLEKAGLEMSEVLVLQ